MKKISEFGLLVRKLRLDHGLKMKDMAESLDVSSAYLSAVELGNRHVTALICAKTYGFFEPKLQNFEQAGLRAALEDLLSQRVVMDFREACALVRSAAAKELVCDPL